MTRFVKTLRGIAFADHGGGAGGWTASKPKRGCSRLSSINMRNRESYLRGPYGRRDWQERLGAANFILRLPGPVTPEPATGAP